MICSVINEPTVCVCVWDTQPSRIFIILCVCVCRCRYCCQPPTLLLVRLPSAAENCIRKNREIICLSVCVCLLCSVSTACTCIQQALPPPPPLPSPLLLSLSGAILMSQKRQRRLSGYGFIDVGLPPASPSGTEEDDVRRGGEEGRGGDGRLSCLCVCVCVCRMTVPLCSWLLDTHATIGPTCG